MEKLTKMQQQAKRAMVGTWKSGVVARSAVGEFSGGLIKPQTLAVEDCKGTGCERLSSPRKTLYTSERLADWIVRKFSENHAVGKVGV